LAIIRVLRANYCAARASITPRGNILEARAPPNQHLLYASDTLKKWFSDLKFPQDPH